MAHKLERLSKSILQKPQLITAEGFGEVKAYLDSRNHEEHFAIAAREDAVNDYRESVSVEDGVALVSISGPMSYRHSWINSLCGIAAHQTLLGNVQAAAEQGAHTIVLDIDSPGGTAYGTFEYSQEVRDICDQNDIKLIAYVDGSAASAAYAWACVADEIVVNPMAKVGSIGVVVSLVNHLPKMMDEGTEVIFVYSGDSKVPYDKEGKIRKETLNEIQDDVDDLYLEFVAHVEKHRPMTSDEIMETEAKMFRADKAVEMGLADQIMTGVEFMEYLADLKDEREDGNMPLFRRDKKQEEFSQSSSVNEEELSNEEIDSSELTQTEEGEETMSGIQMTQEELEAKIAEAREAAQAEAAAQAKELQEKLDKYEADKKAEKLEGIKSSLKEYSFIQEDQVENLASFMMDHEGSPAVEALTATLNSAKAAVEAGLDTELGNAGEEIETDSLSAEKSATDKAIEARYANQSK